MPMKPSLIIPAQDMITITKDEYGVEISSIDQLMEDSVIFISYERLGKVIAYLQDVHMERQTNKVEE